MVENEIRVKSRQNSVVLLQLAGFENANLMDSAVFCQIGMDLQQYIEERLDREDQYSISAVYLHPDSIQTPSLVAQRNVRAVHQLCEALGRIEFSLSIMSPADSETIPAQNLPNHPAFRYTTDYNFWRAHLAFPQPRTMRQFLRSVLEKWPVPSYDSLGQRFLTRQRLAEAFCRVEKEHLGMLQEERARHLEELEQARSNRAVADNEARVAKQELQHVIVQRNTLLQQLSLRDNTEISNILHQFRRLNDEIDEVSLEVAQKIPNNHFEHHPTCSQCHDPSGLREGLGHSNKPLLLIQSRGGASMATRQFVQLYTGSVLCESLYTYVFRPFYPLKPGDPEAATQCEVLAKVYHRLRLRDSQILAAKWRVDSYSSLVELDDIRHDRASIISSHIASEINVAFSHLFGDQVKFPTDSPRLIRLVTNALELNHIFKAEVAHAGDLHAEYFHFNEAYNDSHMEVLDSDEGDRVPSHIVSTCGLGLRITKAIGGKQEPESKVVLRAIVASENMRFGPVAHMSETNRA
ncbi:hypothetical protein FRC06_007291 [Ceratobasidium sp. 370]|nr:hypothetical protein FRC06_007291 [Ceratobasidium sp. 370]